MNFLTEKLKMQRDKQGQKLLRQQYNFPLSPISMLLLSYKGEKQLKISSNIAPGEGG